MRVLRRVEKVRWSILLAGPTKLLAGVVVAQWDRGGSDPRRVRNLGARWRVVAMRWPVRVGGRGGEGARGGRGQPANEKTTIAPTAAGISQRLRVPAWCADRMEVAEDDGGSATTLRCTLASAVDSDGVGWGFRRPHAY